MLQGYIPFPVETTPGQLSTSLLGGKLMVPSITFPGGLGISLNKMQKLERVLYSRITIKSITLITNPLHQKHNYVRLLNAWIIYAEQRV